MNVFDLNAKISLDSGAYEKELGKARDSSESFGSKLSDTLGKVASKVGDALADVGTKLAGFFRDSVQTGMEFDSAMSQVAATLGTTVDEIGNLRDFAMQMGAETKFTSKEAAEALNYMALAGYDAATSMEMLPNVLNLAAAGNFALAKASDMVTDAQTAFGISNDRTKQMIDEMAKASTSGNTSVEQLGDAMLKIGALAKETNGGFVTLADGTQAEVDNIQELEIAFTAMASASIKGSEAGTHMRNMILSLTKGGEAAETAWTQMGEAIGKTGSEMRYTSEGSIRSLKDVLGDMQKAFDKIGDKNQAQKLQWISGIFNVRDESALMSLLDAVESSNWDALGEAILNAEGAAEKMKEVQLDNLSGDVDKMKSAFDNLKIAVSDSFTGPLRDGVQEATRWIGNFQDYVEIFRTNGLGQTLKAIGWDFSAFFDDLGTKLQEGAAFIGEHGADILTEIGTRLTDTDAVKQTWEFARTLFGNLVDGLTSKESMDKLFDQEKGIPKIFSNILKNIAEGAVNIIGFAGELISNVLTYMVDPANKETIENGATDVLVALGEAFVRVVSCIHSSITSLMADIAFAMVGEMPADATALDILEALGKALLRNIWNSSLPGVIQRIWKAAIDRDEMQAYLDDTETTAPTIEAYREELAQREAEHQDMERRSSIAAAGHEDMNDTNGEAYSEWLKSRGYYAVGGVITRPTYALIGESGAEAVMPLEHNTGWIRQLAAELGELGGGQTVIQFGDIYVTGDRDAGAQIVEQIDRALRELQIAQARGIGGTAWK